MTETQPDDLGSPQILRRGLLGAGIALVTAACQPSSTPAPGGATLPTTTAPTTMACRTVVS